MSGIPLKTPNVSTVAIAPQRPHAGCRNKPSDVVRNFKIAPLREKMTKNTHGDCGIGHNKEAGFPGVSGEGACCAPPIYWTRACAGSVVVLLVHIVFLPGPHLIQCFGGYRTFLCRPNSLVGVVALKVAGVTCV